MSIVKCILSEQKRKTAYEYAVNGGYTGTEEEFQTLLGTGPWLPLSGGRLTGLLKGAKYDNHSEVTVGYGALTVGDTQIYDGVIGNNTSNIEFEGGFLKVGGGIGSASLSPVRINNVDTPVENSDATNKKYVDNLFNQIAPGSTNGTGKSAYQYAVDGGYTGTEEEFTELLGSGPWLPTSGGEVSGPLKVQGKLTLGAGGDVFDIPYSSAIGYFGGLSLYGYSIGFANKDDYSKPIPVYGVATPTFPYGAANKAYVDGLVGDIASLLDSINGEVV